MIAKLLNNKYKILVDQGWGAYEAGNMERSEQHFKEVLQNEDDPKIDVVSLIDAHNGMGAVNLEHKDFFEANRWYQEAKYLLDNYLKNNWPKKLDWSKPDQRMIMRCLIGLGHLAYHQQDFKTAEKFYQDLLKLDKEDELGVKKYLEGIKDNLSIDEL